MNKEYIKHKKDKRTKTNIKHQDHGKKYIYIYICVYIYIYT